jgi:hypothetical protein
MIIRNRYGTRKTLDIYAPMVNNAFMVFDQVEAIEPGDAYCSHCDMTYVGVDVYWYTSGIGEAECPECDSTLDVKLPERDEPYCAVDRSYLCNLGRWGKIS